MSNIDRFGTQAAETAMRGAAEYIRVHKLTVDLEAVIVAMRQIVRERLSDALADAKDAFDCGMGEVAELTFLLSMKQCGIDAVKSLGALT